MTKQVKREIEQLKKQWLKDYGSEPIRWHRISWRYNLSKNLMREKWADLDKKYIAIYQQLSEALILEKWDEFDKEELAMNQHIPESLILEKWDEFDKEDLAIYQKLSENLILEKWAEFDKDLIAINQKLPESLILEKWDEFDKYLIAKYQHLSLKARQKLGIEKPSNNWLYTSKKTKLAWIKKNTEFEVYDNDYIIGYKGILKNRYSAFNFRYKYEKGKTYETHCDCNLNTEDSFGFGAFLSRQQAEDYCRQLVIKVKIRITDIGAIVQDGTKVRCKRMTILT